MTMIVIIYIANMPAADDFQILSNDWISSDPTNASCVCALINERVWSCERAMKLKAPLIARDRNTKNERWPLVVFKSLCYLRNY